jgi:hypothetical protein
MRSYPHAEQVRISVYCPNSSLNFLTWNGGMPRIVYLQIAGVHPVPDASEHCISFPRLAEELCRLWNAQVRICRVLLQNTWATPTSARIMP